LSGKVVKQEGKQRRSSSKSSSPGSPLDSSEGAYEETNGGNHDEYSPMGYNPRIDELLCAMPRRNASPSFVNYDDGEMPTQMGNGIVKQEPEICDQRKFKHQIKYQSTPKPYQKKMKKKEKRLPKMKKSVGINPRSKSKGILYNHLEQGGNYSAADANKNYGYDFSSKSSNIFNQQNSYSDNVRVKVEQEDEEDQNKPSVSIPRSMSPASHFTGGRYADMDHENSSSLDSMDHTTTERMEASSASIGDHSKMFTCSSNLVKSSMEAQSIVS